MIYIYIYGILMVLLMGILTVLFMGFINGIITIIIIRNIDLKIHGIY